MIRFLAGLAVAAIVHLVGWPRIESALRTAQAYTRAAYHGAEQAVREQGGTK